MQRPSRICGYFASLAAGLALLSAAGCATLDQGGDGAGQASPEAAQAQFPAGGVPRVRALFTSGDLDQAAQEVGSVLASDPENQEARYWQAMILAGKGDYQGAAAAYDRAFLQGLPKNAVYFTERAKLLWGTGKKEEALAVYSDGLVRFPDDPDLLAGYARALFLSGRELPKAQALAKKAVEKTPGSADNWETLGLLEESLGRRKSAVLAFHRLYLLNPGSQSAQEHLLKNLLLLPPESLAPLAGPEPKTADK